MNLDFTLNSSMKLSLLMVFTNSIIINAKSSLGISGAHIYFFDIMCIPFNKMINLLISYLLKI